LPYKDPTAKRTYQREWMRERRARILAGRTCEWCETADELEIHHRDPNSKVSHRIWSWSTERIASELGKCIVLCRSCHDRGHAQALRVEAELRNPHGTVNRYWLGCRCDPCRTARRERARLERFAAVSVRVDR
jgi:hypothetical protein